MRIAARYQCAGRAGAEMRVVGQQGAAACGMLAVDRPDVGAEPAFIGEGQAGEQCGGAFGHRRRRGMIGGACVSPARGCIVAGDRRHGIGARRRPEVGQGRRWHIGEQARPRQLAPPALDQAQRHRLDQDQAVRRLPGLWAVPKDEEFGRRRVRVLADHRVDPRRIGVEPLQSLGREVLERRLGGAVEAQRAHEAVDREPGLAHHLGEPAGTDPPAHLHLPEPILGVHEAQRHGSIVLVRGLDQRNAQGVAADRHRCPEPGEPDLARELRQRPVAQPRRDPDRGASYDHDRRCRDGEAPAHRRQARRPRRRKSASRPSAPRKWCVVKPRRSAVAMFAAESSMNRMRAGSSATSSTTW